MGYLSISLCHLQFPSSMFYRVQTIGLSPPCLSIFLGIFFFFDMVLNGIFFFLLSLSYSWLLAHGKATDFCILILYPATLLNSFISSNFFFFFCWSIGFSIYSIPSSANSDSFTSSFPTWMVFISFYHLTAVARIENQWHQWC